MAKDDYLKPLLELMQRNSDRADERADKQDATLSELASKLAVNTATTNQILEQAKYTNGRVTKLEKKTSGLERRGLKRLNINEPLLYLILIGAVVLLLIIAKVLGVDVKGVAG